MSGNNKPFHQWVGVVESRQDPLKLGRCRVRVFGEDDGNESKSDNLPFASVSNAPNIRNNKTPYEGDWVWGFYLDGDQKQQPVVAGILHGINSSVNYGSGFADTRSDKDIMDSPSQGRYPLSDEIGKPSTSKYYRGEDVDSAGTLLNKIKTTRIKNIPLPDGSTWSQPEPSYNAKCPYNSVQESESGHLWEIDDTPGAERINIAHRTGTHTEYRPDGSKVQVINGTGYTVVAGDDNIFISVSCNLTVTGNVNILVNGNVNAKIMGNTDVYSKGATTVKTDSTMDLVSKGDMTLKTNSNMVLDADGNVTIKTPDRVTNDTPLVNTTGDIVAKGDIKDVSGGKSMSGMRATFDSHKHPETQSITDVPLEKM